MSITGVNLTKGNNEKESIYLDDLDVVIHIDTQIESSKKIIGFEYKHPKSKTDVFGGIMDEALYRV